MLAFQGGGGIFGASKETTSQSKCRHLADERKIEMLRATLAARIVCPTCVLLGANKGKIVSWNANRGFGFVENGADKMQYFMHNSCVVVEDGDFPALTLGQEVEFDFTTPDERSRVSATNVTSVGGAPLPAGQRPAAPREDDYS
jgi:cold shock CspA family protein